MQSWSFVLFVALSVLLYWTVVPRRFRPHFLLLISIGYYFAANLLFAGFLLVYLYVMFVVGILLDTAATPRGRKAWLVVGITGAISLLFLFKIRTGLIQLIFLLLGLGSGKAAVGLATAIGVPLGISYFTFRVVHYLVEVYRGRGARASLLEFYLYVTFFPAVVSGPIHRFYPIGHEDPQDAFGPQLRREGGMAGFNPDHIGYGLWRILQGVVKKFVLAEFFLRLAAPMMTIQGLSTAVGAGQLWAAGYAWFAYLYLDFSGYMDMAIGMARLFGFRLPENFNWPIFSYNLREFWRRWHTTLTNWLMYYVYVPLGGSRKGELRTNLNIMITLVLIALWHNVSFNLLLWGLMHGVGLLVSRQYLKLKERWWPNRRPSWWGKTIGVVLVYSYFNITWPVFHHGYRIAVVYYLKMFPFLTYFFPALRKLMKMALPSLGG